MRTYARAKVLEAELEEGARRAILVGHALAFACGLARLGENPRLLQEGDVWRRAPLLEVQADRGMGGGDCRQGGQRAT